MNYLLDTNIVLTYIRNSNKSKKIEMDLGLFQGENNLFISVVSIGELKSLAIQNNWGIKKTNTLLELLSQFLITDINVETIIEKYAQIDAFSQGKHKKFLLEGSARNMGKNDLWIAATASVLELELITTDKDFNHLKKNFIKLYLVKI